MDGQADKISTLTDFSIRKFCQKGHEIRDCVRKQSFMTHQKFPLNPECETDFKNETQRSQKQFLEALTKYLQLPTSNLKS